MFHSRNTKLAKFIPTERVNTTICAQNQSVSLTKGNLLDFTTSKGELRDGLGESTHFAHVVCVEVGLRVAKLSDIGTAPGEDFAVGSERTVMIAATGSIDDLLRVQPTGSDKLRLSVTHVVSVTETTARSVAPADKATACSQGQAVLESTAELCDCADGK